MKFFSKASDGGKDSGVTGYFLCEIKPLFSIVLLRFNKGTREAFHEHAFNALSIWLKGRVKEHRLITVCHAGPVTDTKEFEAFSMKYTPRSNCHKVEALEDTWCLSFRGPWVDTWREFKNGKFVTLTHGRKELSDDTVVR